ncbi:threonine/serine exporter family protein [Prolixibacteraceae bacterium JC049]|nr:threonine/serine exporter family protein [Prolixibacteraceae bacterium JC049]
MSKSGFSILLFSKHFWYLHYQITRFRTIQIVMQIPHQYQFIIQLGKALHTYGVPSYKSQIYLTEIAKQNGIKGSFMDTPTWINYVFYEEDEQTYNYIECVPPGELNLGALSKIVEIANAVLNKKMGFDEAKTAIEQIKTMPLGYGKFIELLAFMASAGAFSLVLDYNWTSSIAASGIGAIIYAITLWGKRSNYIRSILESLVAFIATIIAGLLSLKFHDINISMTILASIIVFIPGLSITSALEEITSRSLVSGTAKLFDALVSLFKQFLGVVLGLATLPLFVDLQPNNVVHTTPIGLVLVAIIILAFSLTPVFKIRGKDILFAVIAGFLCFFTTVLLQFTGILISTFIGSMVAVFISKFFRKITHSPALVFLIPGIIMLVPGSKAFIGLSSVFLTESVPHTNMGEQVLYIFMGIIGGLIFSGSFVDKAQNQ